ncbi:MAG: MMPL family transporter [Armatimonadota bacterium]|nr:MMPL family transporter [Armatimonadota bacterium]
MTSTERSATPDSYTGLDAWLARFARFVIRWRSLGVALQVIIALACIWAISGMKLRDDPNQWPPANDPLVQLNRKIAGLYGGGNSVSIEVALKDNVPGDIYTPDRLRTIKSITDSVYLVPGNISYAVRSLSTLNSERYAFEDKGTPNETMLITPIMPQAPKTVEAAKQVGKAVQENPLLNGVLASKDGRSALILGDFRSEVPPGARVKVRTTEPIAIYHAVRKILEQNSAADLTIKAAGTPIIIGWVNSDGLRYVALAFACFLLVIAAVLWYGFHTVSGVFLPLRVALLGTLMGFGIYRLVVGDTLFSAAALLAPFIIVSAGACHSVQFLTRFFGEEYPRLQNQDDAVVSAFVSRLRPMLVSLLCDVVPFGVMAFIPFENVRALGIVTAFGLLALTIDEFLLMIPALSTVSQHDIERAVKRLATKRQEKGNVDVLFTRAVRFVLESRKARLGIVAGTALVTAFCADIVVRTPVGQNNTFAIYNYLTHSWQRNEMYQMEREIVGRFGGVYPMTVLVEGESGSAKVLEQPSVVQAIDKLAQYLRSQPHVGRVDDMASPVKLTNAFWHGEDEAFDLVPKDPGELSSILANIAFSAPGVYDWLFDSRGFDSSVVIAYVDDLEPTVVDRLMRNTQAEANRLFAGLPVKVGIAGGSVGIAQAFNLNVKYWLVAGTLLGFAGTFVLSLPFIGSIGLAAILLIPLAVGCVVSLAIMSLFGIELNSNAVAALAIASGVGIDSEVYLLYRVREEYLQLRNFKEALIQGFVKIRRALVVSNGALILGCWALIPIPLYVGYVGFGMGLVMLVCFIASGTLSPIVWWAFGQKVVIGAVQRHAGKDSPEAERAVSTS